ncbi:MAG: zf-HC2 domain-containing protein [Chloroflexota bacterium]
MAPAERRRVEAHLEGCPACRARLDELATQAAQVSDLLGESGPGALDRPDPRRAWHALTMQMNQYKEMSMLEKLKTSKRAQRVTTFVAALALIVGLFSLAPVRAFASNLLGIFRVERFVVVDVSEERLQEIESALDGSLFGEQEILEDPGDPIEVGSVAEAAALAGFTPRVPSGYGDPVEVAVQGQMKMRYTPDVEGLRSVFATLDVDPDLLPENIDGQPFDFTMPPSVMMAFDVPESEEEIDFMLMQVPSPTTDGPADVDMQALGQAMLQVLGMTPQEAARLSESIDWTSTLVLPITPDLASVQEISVDGTTGLMFDSGWMAGEGDGDWNRSMTLLWQKNGIVTAITSHYGDTYRLLDFAAALQ